MCPAGPLGKCAGICWSMAAFHNRPPWLCPRSEAKQVLTDREVHCWLFQAFCWQGNAQVQCHRPHLEANNTDAAVQQQYLEMFCSMWSYQRYKFMFKLAEVFTHLQAVVLI